MCSSNPTSRRRRLAAGSGNLQVGLSTTKQTEYFPSATTLQPFQPTLQPASAPAKTLSEKIEETFSHYRFYWIGFGVPIFLALFSFLTFFYLRRKALRIHEIDWQAYAELLRMAIWPLLRINESYRAQLNLPKLFLTRRLRVLLGQNPYNYLGMKNSLDRSLSFDENEGNSSKLRSSYSIRSEQDLEVLRYLRGLLIAENDQLRQFSNICASSDLFSASQREELERRKDILREQLLTDDKIEDIIESEMERRKDMLGSENGSEEEGYNKSSHNMESFERPLVALVDASTAVLGAAEHFETSKNMEGLSPQKIRGALSPESGMENFYNHDQSESFMQKENPLRYFSPKRKRYEVNESIFESNPPVTQSREEEENLGHLYKEREDVLLSKETPMRASSPSLSKGDSISTENYKMRLEKALSKVIDDSELHRQGDLTERGADAARSPSQDLVSSVVEATPLSMRALKAESLTQSLPVNSPWAALRSFSPDQNDIEANYFEATEPFVNSRNSPNRVVTKSPIKKKHNPVVHSQSNPVSPRTDQNTSEIRFKDTLRRKTIERLQSTESLKSKSHELTNSIPDQEETQVPPLLDNRFAKYTKSSLSKVKQRIPENDVTSPTRTTIELKRPGIHSKISAEEKSPRLHQSSPTAHPSDAWERFNETKSSEPFLRGERSLDSRGSKDRTNVYENIGKVSPRVVDNIDRPRHSQNLPTPNSPPIYRYPPQEVSRIQPYYSQSPPSDEHQSAMRRPAVLPPLQFSKPRAVANYISPRTGEVRLNNATSTQPHLYENNDGEIEPELSTSPKKAARNSSENSRSEFGHTSR